VTTHAENALGKEVQSPIEAVTENISPAQLETSPIQENENL